MVLLAVLSGVFIFVPSVARSVGLAVERRCLWNVNISGSVVDLLILLREAEVFMPGVSVFVLVLVGLCLSFLFLGFVSGLHSVFKRAREMVLSYYCGWRRYFRRDRR